MHLPHIHALPQFIAKHLLGYQNLEQMLIYLPHLLDRLPHLLNTAKACSMENISTSPPHPHPHPSTPICLFSQTLSDD